MNEILISGSLSPTTTDTPISAKARINSLSDIVTIENPAIGEMFYCRQTKKVYVINSLKSKTIAGVSIPNAEIDEYAPVGPNLDQDKTYYFEQTTPNSQWDITHNLKKYPSVVTMDSEHRVIFGEVQHMSENRVVISFSIPVVGSATLN